MTPPSSSQTNAMLQAIIGNMLDGLITIDEQGVIESFNKACEKIFGYQAEEIIGQNIKILMPEAYGRHHDRYLKNYVKTGKASVLGVPRELEGLKKDGTVFPIELSANKVRLDNKTIFIGIIRDVTVRKKMEHQLFQAQKMEAVGLLTGGIAHDFNNLLTIIFGNLRLLDKELKSSSEPDIAYCLGKAGNIQSAAERGSDLVKHLMVFARQQELQVETISVNNVITNMMQLLRRSLGEMIDINVALSEHLWAVDVDAGMLERVLINMCVNARDAMPDGGTLTLRTHNFPVRHGLQIPDMELSPGDYVEITIIDTGIGIPSTNRQQIFDPFFTTKEVGKGTGLGLSMAYGFIRESGGSIRVSSALRKGSTFHIYLPKSKAKKPLMALKPVEQHRYMNGNETIMVVEDENEIRELASRFLKESGYKVLEAGNGQDALNILKDSSQPVDVLFTDIVMPGGMNGVQLAGRAQSIRPEMKLLFTSGYMGDTLPDFALAREYPFIDKPYSPETLVQKIRYVLDQSSKVQ